MSSAKPTGGPAFPTTEANGCNIGDPGMDLRDAFAIAALPQLLLIGCRIDVAGNTPAQVAEAAYKMADAMLAARAEVKP
jgi:hypothetical protein